MAQYPEHEKLEKIKDKSQAIADFLDWLSEDKGFNFGQYHEHTEQCYSEDGEWICDEVEGRLYPAPFNKQKLLAEFYEIDLNKLEEEKRAMLDSLRAANP